MDWIELAQDRDNWLAVVNTAITSGTIKSEGFLGSLQNYCQKKQNGGKVHELEIV